MAYAPPAGGPPILHGEQTITALFQLRFSNRVKVRLTGACKWRCAYSESVATRVQLSRPVTYQQNLITPAAEILSPAETPLIDLKERADVRRLFELDQLEVNFDEADGALWAFMRPDGRPELQLGVAR